MVVVQDQSEEVDARCSLYAVLVFEVVAFVHSRRTAAHRVAMVRNQQFVALVVVVVLAVVIVLKDGGA
jgi:hypothetical protein